MHLNESFPNPFFFGEPNLYIIVGAIMGIFGWIIFFILQLHGVDDAIDKSKRILTSMSRRMSRNKLVVGSIIAALVLAIILILYFKLSH